MESEYLPRLRDSARFIDDETGDRGGFLVRQIPGHGAIEIADRHGAFNDHGAVGHQAHALNDKIMLVGDVADDFLENVL